MRLVAVAVLTLLFGTMSLSLFYISTNTDPMGSMSDCSSVVHEEVICPMDLANHIGAWKSVFVTVVPTIFLLLTVVGAVGFVASVAPYLLTPRQKPIRILYRQLRERTYLFTYRPFQELFSNGILHPKVF